MGYLIKSKLLNSVKVQLPKSVKLAYHEFSVLNCNQFNIITIWYLITFDIAMKKPQIVIFILPAILLITSCTRDTADIGCYHGIILGKIRSAGGGVAISMFESDFSNHTWRGNRHVVEALNIPGDYWTPGKTIYFDARPATNTEKDFPVTSDGDESAKPIIFVLQFSFNACP